MPATPPTAVFSGLLLLAAASAAAQSWPTSALALRTDGSSFREGQCVRLSLLALEDVGGPFVPKVSYGYEGSVTLKDPQGQPRTIPLKRTVERPARAALERLDAGTAAVLDDAFCFGMDSAAGAYEITVSLTSGNVTIGTLAACVEFQPESVAGPAAASRCQFALRAVSKRSEANVLTLEGQWPFEGSGLFRLVFLRGDRVLSLLEGGLVAEGPGELTFVVPNLGVEGEAPVDLLLQDQWGGKATTLAGVVLQR